jgi:hypothetical protein
MVKKEGDYRVYTLHMLHLAGNRRGIRTLIGERGKISCPERFA